MLAADELERLLAIANQPLDEEEEEQVVTQPEPQPDPALDLETASESFASLDPRPSEQEGISIEDALASVGAYQTPGFKMPRSLGEEFSVGLARGVDQTQGLGYGLVGLMGQALGVEQVEDFGLENYVRKMEEAALNEASIKDPTEDIGGLGDAGLYAAGLLGEQIPQLLASAVGGGVGGVVGKSVAKRVIANEIEKRLAAGLTKEAAETQVARLVAQGTLTAASEGARQGGIAGAYLANYGQIAGGSFGQIAQETGEGDALAAATFAAPGAALDTLGEVFLAGKFLKPFTKAQRAVVEGVAPLSIGRIGGGAATAGAAGAALEGGTEYVQTGLEQAAVGAADPNRTIEEVVSTPEAGRERLIAGIAGATVGAPLGGAGGVVEVAFSPQTTQALNQKLQQAPATQEEPQQSVLAGDWSKPVQVDDVTMQRNSTGLWAVVNPNEDLLQGFPRLRTEDGNSLLVVTPEADEEGRAAFLVARAEKALSDLGEGEIAADFQAQEETQPEPEDELGEPVELDEETEATRLRQSPQGAVALREQLAEEEQISEALAEPQPVSETEATPAPIKPAAESAAAIEEAKAQEREIAGSDVEASYLRRRLAYEESQSQRKQGIDEALARPQTQAVSFVEGLQSGQRVGLLLGGTAQELAGSTGVFVGRRKNGNAVFEASDLSPVSGDPIGKKTRVELTPSQFRRVILAPPPQPTRTPIEQAFDDALGPNPTKQQAERVLGSPYTGTRGAQKSTFSDGLGSEAFPIEISWFNKKGDKGTIIPSIRGTFTNSPFTTVRQMNQGLEVVVPDDQLGSLSKDIQVEAVSDKKGGRKNIVTGVNLWGRTYRRSLRSPKDFSVDIPLTKRGAGARKQGLLLFDNIYKNSPERIARSEAAVRGAQERQTPPEQMLREWELVQAGLNPVEYTLYEDALGRVTDFINRSNLPENVKDEARFEAQNNVVKAFANRKKRRGKQPAEGTAALAKTYLEELAKLREGRLQKTRERATRLIGNIERNPQRMSDVEIERGGIAGPRAAEIEERAIDEAMKGNEVDLDRAVEATLKRLAQEQPNRRAKEVFETRKSLRSIAESYKNIGKFNPIYTAMNAVRTADRSIRRREMNEQTELITDREARERAGRQRAEEPETIQQNVQGEIDRALQAETVQAVDRAELPEQAEPETEDEAPEINPDEAMLDQVSDARERFFNLTEEDQILVLSNRRLNLDERGRPIRGQKSNLTQAQKRRAKQIEQYLQRKLTYANLYPETPVAPQQPRRGDQPAAQIPVSRFSSGEVLAGVAESGARGRPAADTQGRPESVGRPDRTGAGTVQGADPVRDGGSGVRASLAPQTVRRLSRAAKSRFVQSFGRLTDAEASALTEAEIDRAYEAIVTRKRAAAVRGNRVVSGETPRSLADLGAMSGSELLAGAVGAMRAYEADRARVQTVRDNVGALLRARAFADVSTFLGSVAESNAPQDVKLRAREFSKLLGRGVDLNAVGVQIGRFGDDTSWAGLFTRDSGNTYNIALNLDAQHDRDSAINTMLHELSHVVTSKKIRGEVRLNNVERNAINRLEALRREAVVAAARDLGLDVPRDLTDADIERLSNDLDQRSLPQNDPDGNNRVYAGLANLEEFTIEVSSNPELAGLMARLGFGQARGRVTLLNAIRDAWNALVELVSGVKADPNSPLARAFKDSWVLNYSNAGGEMNLGDYTMPEIRRSAINRELARRQEIENFVEQEVEARNLAGTTEEREAVRQQVTGPADPTSRAASQRVADAANRLTQDEFVQWAQDNGFNFVDPVAVYNNNRTTEQATGDTVQVAESRAGLSNQTRAEISATGIARFFLEAAERRAAANVRNPDPDYERLKLDGNEDAYIEGRLAQIADRVIQGRDAEGNEIIDKTHPNYDEYRILMTKVGRERVKRELPRVVRETLLGGPFTSGRGYEYPNFYREITGQEPPPAPVQVAESRAVRPFASDTATTYNGKTYTRPGLIFGENANLDPRATELVAILKRAKRAAEQYANLKSRELNRLIRKYYKNQPVPTNLINDALGNLDNPLTDQQFDEIKRLELTDPDAAVKKRIAYLSENRARFRTERQAPALLALPEELAEFLREIGGSRETPGDLYKLQEEALKLGIPKGDMATAFSENLGIYLTRSYNAFLDQEGWERTLRAEDAALGEHSRMAQFRNTIRATLIGQRADDLMSEAMAQGRTLSRAEAERQAKEGTTTEEVDQMLESYIAYTKEEPSSESFSGLRLPGRQNIKSLEKRKMLSDALREFYGQVENPAVNFVTSYAKLSSLIANHQFQTSLKNLGMKEGWLWDQERNPGQRPPAGYERIAADNDKSLKVLAGLYARSDLVRGLRETFPPNSMEAAQWWLHPFMKLTGLSMGLKTVGSIVSQIRNYWSSYAPIIAGGNMTIADWFRPEWRKNWKEAHEVSIANVFRKYGGDRKKMTDRIKRLFELGVMGESLTVGLLNDLTRLGKDASISDEQFFNNFEKILKKPGRRVWNATKQVWEKAEQVYGMTDDIFKVLTYLSEFDKYQKVYPNMPEAELEKKAADIARDIHWTYSKAPAAVNELKKFPFIAPFVTFTTETIRITVNLGKLAINERKEGQRLREQGLRENNAELVRQGDELLKISNKRMRGMAAIAFGPWAVGSLAMTAAGFSGDDEEDLRQFLPDWQKNSQIIILGRDGSDINYVDVSYLDPFEVWKKPMTAFLRGLGRAENVEEVFTEAVVGAALEAARPFTSEQILSGAVMDVMRNRDANGRQVYNPQDTGTAIASAVSAKLASAFTPGTLDTVDRIYKASAGQMSETGRAYQPFNEWGSLVFGQRVSAVDAEQALGFKASQFLRARRDARSIFNRDFLSRGSRSESDVISAYQRSNAGLRDVTEQLRKEYLAAINLGVSPAKARSILRASGLDRDSARMVSTGIYRRLTPSEEQDRMAAPDRKRAARQAIAETPQREVLFP